MPTGENLFRCLASLILRESCGIVSIQLCSGKVTHVKMVTPRMWEYRHLPKRVPTHAAPSRPQ
jgi:hypothetical protein